VSGLLLSSTACAEDGDAATTNSPLLLFGGGGDPRRQRKGQEWDMVALYKRMRTGEAKGDAAAGMGGGGCHAQADRVCFRPPDSFGYILSYEPIRC
jgi:hypothetical protein